MHGRDSGHAAWPHGGARRSAARRRGPSHASSLAPGHSSSPAPCSSTAGSWQRGLRERRRWGLEGQASAASPWAHRGGGGRLQPGGIGVGQGDGGGGGCEVPGQGQGGEGLLGGCAALLPRQLRGEGWGSARGEGGRLGGTASSRRRGCCCCGCCCCCCCCGCGCCCSHLHSLDWGGGSSGRQCHWLLEASKGGSSNCWLGRRGQCPRGTGCSCSHRHR